MMNWPQHLVSVIVPAHDAAATLADTLESLLVQTAQGWEAIIVDDGSRDRTAAIARAYAERDPRIRLISQAQAGEGGARNAGIAQATGEWLLFLDSDDWLDPSAIESFGAALSPGVEGVIARWQRVMADGTRLDDAFRQDPGTLFETTARFCPFAIHACLVSRARVEQAGGFDTRLTVGADWDLWQRLARAGTRFVSIDDILAFYRTRPQSAGVNVPKLVESGVRLITLGHSSDPRVRAPDPRFAAGAPADQLPSALFGFISWPAGMLLGTGADAAPLVEAVRGYSCPGLDPAAVAQSIFSAAMLPSSHAPSQWATLWPSVAAKLRLYLRTLEEASGASGLAERAELVLAGMILEASPGTADLSIGPVARTAIELGNPVRDRKVEPGVARLMCVFLYDGEELGRNVLPVSDGRVSAESIARAAAEHHGWEMLGRYFGRHIYPGLEFRPNGEGVDVYRNGCALQSGLPSGYGERSALLHDAIGWPLLLQELAGPPPAARNDSADADEVVVPLASPAGAEPWQVEILQPFSNLRMLQQEMTVDLRLCGEHVEFTRLKPSDGKISATRLHAVVMECGYGLAKIAVRNALIGVPLGDPRSLRERLIERAEAN
jgi:hypothetical protein